MSRSNARLLNGMNEDYKSRYKTALAPAIQSYLNWMDTNVKGTRFITRWNHFNHGDSGVTLAKKLKALLATEATFYEVVSLTQKVFDNSTNAEHSLKRYIYSAFTGDAVVDQSPRVNSRVFFDKVDDRFADEFKALHDQQGAIDVNTISFYNLTLAIGTFSNFSALLTSERTQQLADEEDNGVEETLLAGVFTALVFN